MVGSQVSRAWSCRSGLPPSLGLESGYCNRYCPPGLFLDWSLQHSGTFYCTWHFSSPPPPLPTPAKGPGALRPQLKGLLTPASGAWGPLWQMQLLGLPPPTSLDAPGQKRNSLALLSLREGPRAGLAYYITMGAGPAAALLFPAL